ncbi:sigma-70 family RNA polymerase sigma factor [Bacillaceae bacterium W0354]
MQSKWKDIHSDDDLFLEMMQVYRVDLYKTALSFLKNKHDALEAIQEVTYRAYKKRKTLKKPQYAKTWLIRIMINYCQDQIKKSKKLVHGFDFDRVESDSNEENYLLIEQLISRLNRNEQELIYLKYFHGLTYVDLSEQLDTPEGTLKTRIHHALRKLREEFKEYEGGDYHEEYRGT